MSLEMAELLKKEIDYEQPECNESPVTDDNKRIVLNKNESEVLTDFIKCLIENDIDYYTNCSQKEMGEEERADYFTEITRLCVMYGKFSGAKTITLSAEDIRKVALDIDFGVFEIIKSSDADNIVWLWRLTELWHKLAVLTDIYEKCDI